MPVYIHSSLGNDAEMVRQVLNDTRMLAWTVHLTDQQNDMLSVNSWPEMRSMLTTYMGRPIDQGVVSRMKKINNTILFQLLSSIQVFTTGNLPTPEWESDDQPLYDPKVHVSNIEAMNSFLLDRRFDACTIVVIRANSYDQFRACDAVHKPAAHMLGPILVLFPGFFTERHAARLTHIQPDFGLGFAKMGDTRTAIVYRELTRFELAGHAKDIPVPVTYFDQGVIDELRQPGGPSRIGVELEPDGVHLKPYSVGVCAVLAERNLEDARQNAHNIMLYAVAVWLRRVYPELAPRMVGSPVRSGMCDSRFDTQRHHSMGSMRGLRDYDAGADGGSYLGPGTEFNLNDATVRASRQDGDECFLDDENAGRRIAWRAVDIGDGAADSTAA